MRYTRPSSFSFFVPPDPPAEAAPEGGVFGIETESSAPESIVRTVLSLGNGTGTPSGPSIAQLSAITESAVVVGDQDARRRHDPRLNFLPVTGHTMRCYRSHTPPSRTAGGHPEPSYASLPRPAREGRQCESLQTCESVRHMFMSCPTSRRAISASGPRLPRMLSGQC